MGVKMPGDDIPDVLLRQAYHPFVLLARSFDRRLRQESDEGDILPSTTRSKNLEAALCKALDDDLLLMGAE